MPDRRLGDRPDTPDEPGAYVRYDVRELLAKIERGQAEGFARITEQLAAKAGKADLAKMEARLDNHATRLSSLEEARREQQVSDAALRRDRQQRWSWPKRAAAGAMSLALIAATFLGPFLATSGHH